jgi:glutathione S-transferase
VPTITAFKSSPDKGVGLARDMRVRWALEEVGQSYDVRLVTFKELKQPAHLALQPFGQIPTYEDGDVALFESGAIVFHIAERHAGLLPGDGAGRARAISWMFAALNTVEPPIIERDYVKYFEADKSWQAERFAMVDDRIRTRLDQLAAALGEPTWLAGPFSAADILMVHAIRRLEGSGILEEYPIFMDYIARAAERPAYKRAFDAQYEVFQQASSK